MKIRLFVLVLATALIALFFTTSASAQLTSTPSVVTVNATIGETLTLNCTPSSVTISGAAGGPIAYATAPVVCTFTYGLAATRSKLYMYIYPTSGGNALTGPGGTIPSSDVSVTWNGTFMPCSQTDPYSGVACDMNAGGTVIASSTGTDDAPWPTGSVNESLTVGVAFPAGAAVGTYSGTLTIVAQAI